MKITKKMIDKQMRLKGTVMGIFLNLLFSNEKRLKKVQHILRKSVKAKAKEIDNVNLDETYIKRNDGTQLRLCVYKSSELKQNATGVLWIHGGGYAIGTPEIDMSYYQKLLSCANCVIISPDYTLSTSMPYPAALDDCYAALVWMKENAQDLGIRDDQLFVCGNSAGGGLAIATTLYARDKGDVNIAFLMPLYPMIDYKMNTSSAINNNAPIWNEKNNTVSWRMYLGDLFGSSYIPSYASPARETNFFKLPPVYTFVGNIEPFYDETVTFISNLKNAGVSAEISVYKGCFHAFDQICPKADVSQDAIEKMVKHFVYAVNHHFAEQNTMQKPLRILN